MAIVRNIAILSFALLATASCSSSALVGKSYVSDDGLWKFEFVSNRTFVYTQPCTDRPTCKDGTISAKLRYRLKKDNVDIGDFSTAGCFFPFDNRSFRISPDGRQLSATVMAGLCGGTPVPATFTLRDTEPRK